MEISIKVPALISLVVVSTAMIFGLGYVYGRADIPLRDVRCSVFGPFEDCVVPQPVPRL